MKNSYLNIKKRTWSILVYILFLVAIIVTIFSFVAIQAFSNLDVLNSIKKSFKLYVTSIWDYEQKIVEYYDDPIYWHNYSENFSILISRYKKFIEWFVDKNNHYAFSLTDMDSEYSNEFKKLKYLDLFWNDKEKNITTKCDLKMSFLKWNKWDKIQLTNKKNLIERINNPNLVSASYSWSTSFLINFSTWVTNLSWWALVKTDFEVSTWVINSISTSDNINFIISLSSPVSVDLLNCTNWCLLVNVKSNTVKNAGWIILQKEKIPVKTSLNKYENRVRITDSIASMNTTENNFLIFLNSDNYCFFGLEWFDENSNIISIPDSKIEWKVDLYDKSNPFINKKTTFIENFNFNKSSSLSNYLYKINE